MSGINLSFGDGSYHFFATWAGLAEVERKCDATILTIFERMMDGRAGLNDVVEMLRQGLLGGSGGTADGTSIEPKPHIVNALLERYVTGADRLPFIDNLKVAQVILSGAMLGYPEAQKKTQEPSEASIKTE